MINLTAQQKALAFITEDLLKSGYTVELNSAQYIDVRGGKCSGYVDWETRSLRVAAGREKWLETFVHEYCHVIQNREGCFTEDEAWNLYETWLAGSNEDPIDIGEVVTAADYIARCELDCEQRTVKFFERFGIPLDVETYIRKANAYVLFYEVTIKDRRWYDVGPYDVRSIVDLMPKTWVTDLHELPKGFLEEVRKHCFKPKNQPIS